MSRLKDLTGQRFGMLVVKGRATNHTNTSGRSDVRWFVVCECGTSTTMLTLNLRRSKSCGCNRRVPKLAPGKSSCRVLLNTYRAGAKKRGYSFDLSFEEFEALTSCNCHYCGASPAQQITGTGCQSSYCYNGIDRKDNSEGYAAGNALPCCWRCNKAKGTLAYEDFRDWIKKSHDHLYRDVA